MKCNQKDCPNEAAYRFAWPGLNSEGVCREHVPVVRAVAITTGLRLQLEALLPEPADATHDLGGEG